MVAAVTVAVGFKFTVTLNQMMLMHKILIAKLNALKKYVVLLALFVHVKIIFLRQKI
jgi:hypothetical protein